MPYQTTGRGKIRFPDGVKVEAMAEGSVSWMDMGCIEGDTEAVLNWDENRVQLANCEDPAMQIKNLNMTGSINLVDLDPESINEISGGIFTYTGVAGSTINGVDNQVIAIGGWADKEATPLILKETATGLTFKASAEPVIASVTGSTDGALTVTTDYWIQPDTNAKSGYSIVLNLASVNVTTLSQTITIAYTSFDPIQSKILTAGSSTEVLSPFKLRFTHTDDATKIVRLDLFRVDPQSGAFPFGYKGQNSDGVETMAFTFVARCDSALTAKQQLMQWTFEEGAQ